MDYGGILTDTFRVIWKEKKLWVISAVGVLFFALSSMIYMGSAVGWQMNVVTSFPKMFMGDIQEGDMFNWLARFFLGYLVIAILAWLFGLMGYIVNLIARAGVVAEAARALRGEKTDISRGLGRGVHKAPAYFVLDLLWTLPWILVGGFVVILALFLGGGMGFMASGENFDEGGIVLGLVSLMFLIMGLFACLALIYGLFKGVFAPLMYQASVVDDKSLGDAISTGWRLAKENIGPMFIFLLLIWVVMIALSILLRFLMLPFSMMLMGPWFTMMQSFEQGVTPSGMNAGNWVLVFLSSVGMGLLIWLWMSVKQTIYLVYYTKVYQALRGEEQFTSANEELEVSEAVPSAAE